MELMGLPYLEDPNMLCGCHLAGPSIELVALTWMSIRVYGNRMFDEKRSYKFPSFAEMEAGLVEEGKEDGDGEANAGENGKDSGKAGENSEEKEENVEEAGEISEEEEEDDSEFIEETDEDTWRLDNL